MQALAADLWAAAKPSTTGPAPHHPAGRWLRHFGVWPAGEPLPDAVRWLERDKMPAGRDVHEDHIASSGRLGRDPRPRLLIPERAGGPGPQSEFIPYPVLLARSGFHFDLTDPRSAAATRKLWERLSGELKERGYTLPSLSAQAEAGDTFEIVNLVKGSRGGYGGIIVRASDRWIEAQAAVSRKRGDEGLDMVPLPRLFD